MKLNLLPTYVSKEGSTRRAWLLAAVLFIGGLAACAFLISSSSNYLASWKKAQSAQQEIYDKVKAHSAKADEIIQTATPLLRNINLSKAMAAHNSVYPELYEKVFRYVPGFFRLTSISSQAQDANTLVTMTGTLHTYQEYADLMLALLRIPGATQVSRSGYNLVETTVPGLSLLDQVGLPRRGTEAPLPSDPLLRLEELTRRQSEVKETPTLGYGTTDLHGPMPDWSLVTVSVLLEKTDVRAPDPAATLKGGGGGRAGSSSASSGPGPAGAAGTLTGGAPAGGSGEAQG